VTVFVILFEAELVESIQLWWSFTVEIIAAINN